MANVPEFRGVGLGSTGATLITITPSPASTESLVQVTLTFSVAPDSVTLLYPDGTDASGLLGGGGTSYTFTPTVAGAYVAGAVVDGSEVGSVQVPVGRDGWIKRGTWDCTGQGAHDYTSTATKTITADNGATIDTTWATNGSPTVTTAALSGAGLTLDTSKATAAEAQAWLSLDPTTVTGWTPGADEEILVELYISSKTTTAVYNHTGLRFYAASGPETSVTWTETDRASYDVHLGRYRAGSNASEWTLQGAVKPQVLALRINPAEATARALYQNAYGAALLGPAVAGYTTKRTFTLTDLSYTVAGATSLYSAADPIHIGNFMYQGGCTTVVASFAIWSRSRA